MLLWTFNAAEIVLYSSPDLCLDTILSWRSTDNSLNFMACFVIWHAVLPVGPYIDMCLPFQIMSNQLNLPQVDSKQAVETSQGWSVESGCIWAHVGGKTDPVCFSTISCGDLERSVDQILIATKRSNKYVLFWWPIQSVYNVLMYRPTMLLFFFSSVRLI